MSKEVKHKLYDHAVTPPPGVWEKIVAELDNAIQGEEYPARLYQMEVPPPPAVWERIVSVLDAGPKQTVPGRHRIIPVLRYAAAAAVIAFLVWGGLRLNSGSRQNEIVTTKADPQGKDPIIPESITPTPVKPEIAIKKAPITEDARNDAALEASKKTYAKLSLPARSKIINPAGFHFSLDNIQPIPSSEMDPATRYIVLMTPDGNIIRMSKKLSDLVCCVSGEEQDSECIDQMKKWREKLASSSGTFSSSNFGDLLNLVKSLQE